MAEGECRVPGGAGLEDEEGGGEDEDEDEEGEGEERENDKVKDHFDLHAYDGRRGDQSR